MYIYRNTLLSFFICAKMIKHLLQLLFLAIFGANLVDAKWLSVIPNAPVRSISKVFGVPTWLSHIEGILSMYINYDIHF